MDGLPHLRDLPLLARLGVSCLLLTVLYGLAVASVHLVVQHQSRDQRDGLSLADLQAAYHGARTVAPMLVALQRGHPDNLPASERDALLGWLHGSDLSETYDSLELGASAPAEILQRRCLSCHARAATDGGDIGQRVPLEYWDDVQKVSSSRDVEPIPTEIVLASSHTHALAMATLSLVLVGLALLTRWSPRWIGALVLACGGGLLLDLAAWLPARSWSGFVLLLAAAGALWLCSTALLALLVLVDLWWPRARMPANG